METFLFIKRGGHCRLKLNLFWQGSLAGRMEQNYMDILPTIQFTPKLNGTDGTNVTF